MRRRLVIVLAAAFAAAGTGASPAGAAARGTVCSAQATVYDTPGGLVVGVLVRGDRVRVLRRSRNRVWVRVRSDIDIRGWVRGRALC